MDDRDLPAAKLAVNSSEQRHALLYACECVRESEQRAVDEATHDCGFDRRRCERHIAEAAALEGELERGYATVAVGLGIATGVAASLAELIEAEMHERVHCSESAPPGLEVRRAAGLMWTLVALDAEVQREILPAHGGPR
jgi:hypothetical protein